ncbi:hypothetical protein ACFYTQ_27370 [Nocardia sp. NPDC004068]|uniref:hypothetical protein n=1 Tax=Nocardia sp. NPDC004068 TaxID=3364303 RepID=UPI0036AA5A62
MTHIDARAKRYFSEDEIAEIRAHSISLESGDVRDAIRLADSWAAHVEKIDRDRSLPWSDRSVWNEYDFCTALTIRDYVKKSVDGLPPVLAVKMEDYISEADDRFTSITVEDSGRRITAVAKVARSERDWWWFRVPDSGPVLKDLAR